MVSKHAHLLHHAAPYILKRELSLRESFYLIMEGQCNQAISLCGMETRQADRIVHEMRKCTKRIRALLKLYRYAIGEELYAIENARYQAISQGLAPLRTSAARIAAIERLSAGSRLAVHRSDIRRLIRDCRESHTLLVREAFAKKKLKQQLRGTWKDCLNKTPDIPELACTFPALTEGLMKTYATGMRARSLALSQPLETNIHDFRKAAKNLWYQMQILRPVWPAVTGSLIRQLDLLGERLGTGHDLAELETYLQGIPVTGYKFLPLMLEQAEHYRKRLQEQCWPLSARIYAERPRSFVRRMEAYWKVKPCCREHPPQLA